MKKKLNQLTLFGTVLVLFILHSCTKDDFIETNHHSQVNNQRTAFEKKILFSEVNLDSKILGNIKISSENQNVVMRTSSEYNTIVIDTTQVSYIERGAYHSYTFLVKNNESENITENLVLSSKADGTYNTALFRYNLTEQDKLNISNDIEIDYTGKLEVVNLESSSQNQTTYSYTTTSSSCFGEVQIYVSCCSGQHYWGELCDYEGGDCAPKPPYTAIVITDDCFNGGSNGDGSNPGTETGDGNNGLPGGGTGNGNNTNPTIPNNPDNPENPNNPKNPETDFGDVITKPLLEFNPQQPKKTNCESLKDLVETDSLNANIKPLVDNLRNKLSADVEYAYNFKRTPEYDVDTDTEYYKTSANDDGMEAGESRNDAPLYAGVSYMGQIHTHPVDTYAMFSWTDLYNLRNLYQYATEDNKQEVFLMIVCHNGAVYALKIDDFQSFNQKINSDLNNSDGKNQDEKEKELNEKLGKEYKKDNNLERAFLKRFAQYGISIYKASDENLSNWDKLELNNPNINNSTVVPNSCN